MTILLSEHIADFDLDIALKEISEQRRAYVLKYKRELDRRLAVKSYLLLCEGLKSQYGIDEKPLFSYTANGKPTLTDYPEIHFNISHCDEAVLCVIDNHPIGVDIESVRPYDEELVTYTMNPEEQEQIKSSEHPGIEFTRLWTRKEAVLKQSGKGITSSIQNVLTENQCSLTTVVGPNQKYVYSICT